MKATAYAGALALAALSVVLGGCAGQAPGASEPVVASTGIASPAPSGPQQRFPLSCSDLLSDDLVTSIVGADVVPADLRTDAEFTAPNGHAVLQAGGLICLWSYGQPIDSGRQGPSAGVRIVVRPDAQAQWDAYAAVYGEAALRARCSAGVGSSPTVCYDEFSDHGYWVDATFFGVGGARTPTESEALDIARPGLDRVAAAIRALPAPTPPWVAPASTSDLPTAPADPAECEALLPIERVRTALGVSAKLAHPAGDGWNLPGTIMTDPAAGGCPLGIDATEEAIGIVTWLRSGSWGYDRGLGPVHSDPGADLSALGLAASDAATLQCRASYPDCILDLRLGTDWVRVKLFAADSLSPEAFPVADFAAARANITRLGALIVAHASAR